jgi:DNA-binding transcriptional LysR family regulator
MKDLDDLYLFAKVVEHGGFSLAARAMSMPKSTISRRIALLEERLGVRLLQRTTRHFRTTEIGQMYYRHCAAVTAEAEAAQEAIERMHAEPRGMLRINCPVAFLHGFVATIVSRFMIAYPGVQIQLTSNNRRVDVIEEGFDIALRVRYPPLENSDLVMKTLGVSHQILVASPALLERNGPLGAPLDIARLGSMDLFRDANRHSWHLANGKGEEITIPHEPRFVTDDMNVLAQAAVDGVGVVQLPDFTVRDLIARGELAPALPGWTPRSGIIHAVFPSRRGLVPVVRRFIDFLAEELAAPERR